LHQCFVAFLFLLSPNLSTLTCTPSTWPARGWPRRGGGRLRPDRPAAAQLARRHGATRLLAAEPLPHRMAVAESLGAEPAAGAGVADVVFEVSGSEAAVDTALRLAKPGARVVLVGIPDGDRTSFSAGLARRKGLTLVLARRMGEVYPRAIDLAARGLVDLAPLVSDVFGLGEAATALKTAAARTGLKVVIHPQR
ncbi:zinc-binding dehydrogenase, partial [Actinoplanes nipponensis]|uniref:zinc-binding dehydrogenase n=1 Tax=Actinoplanes nipponensis TaxID=135950 RepID=UPI0031ECB09C